MELGRPAVCTVLARTSTGTRHADSGFMEPVPTTRRTTMNRRLIGVIAGVSVLGLGVPAFAAARGGGRTPKDNNVPGDVRGNCDEAEHATDAECLDADPSATTILVTTTAAPETTAAPTSSIDDDEDDDAATSTVPATAETVTTVEDISGPCDEAEHADDPR